MQGGMSKSSKDEQAFKHSIVRLLSASAGPESLFAETSDGGSLPPSELLVRLQGKKAAMGITRVANVTGLDRIGIPVMMVCRPNARSLAVSQGKGLDLDTATISGLMEAVELHHAEHIALPLKLGSFAELAGSHSMINVDRLAKVRGSAYHRDLQMLWVEGIDLFSGGDRLLPFECVRANFTLPAPPGSGCFDCSSNGLGSGTTMAGAICHAICEIIERDATALWNARPLHDRRKTGLYLSTLDDPHCTGLLAKFDAAEIDVAVFDTTSDSGIASFFCAITDRRDTNGHLGIGAAAHPARATALMKALTEAAQVRMTYVSGARDDLEPEEFAGTIRSARLDFAKRLSAEHRPVRSFREVPDTGRLHPPGMLGYLLKRLSAVGVDEVVAVNLSKPEIGIPVVRVVIPGFEGPDDHAAYLPGERGRRVKDLA
jgi:YcaO-like protein with predicted kinase domain